MRSRERRRALEVEYFCTLGFRREIYFLSNYLRLDPAACLRAVWKECHPLVSYLEVPSYLALLFSLGNKKILGLGGCQVRGCVGGWAFPACFWAAQ